MSDKIKGISDKILSDNLPVEDMLNLEKETENASGVKLNWGDQDPNSHVFQEVFGPSKIMCDEKSCKFNTKGKCQQSKLNIQGRFCTNYKARGL